MKLLISKPVFPQLVYDNPYAGPLLAHFLPMQERAGNPLDFITNRTATLTGSYTAQPWGEARTFGYALQFQSTGSQYLDCGHISEVDGASRFTWIALMRRTAASGFFPIQMGNSLTNRVAIMWLPDGKLYFIVANGGDVNGNVVQNDGNWHHVAMVFDGTLTGNSNRLKGYVDGAGQTLSFFNTIPATAPTNAQSLRIGSNADGPGFGNGGCAGFWHYKYAMTATDVERHRQNVYQMLEPPPLRRSVIYDAAPYAPIVLFSEAEPSQSPAERDDEISILATPTTSDLIASLTADVDNVAQTVSVATEAPNAKRGLISPYRFQFGHTYTVRWRATTVNGVVNNYTQTFTVRVEDGGSPGEGVQLLAPDASVTPDMAQMVVPPRTSAWAELVQTIVLSTGAVGSDRIEILAINGLPLWYYSAEKVAEVVASLVEIPEWLPLSIDVGPGDTVSLQLTDEVEGEDVAGLTLAEDVISNEQLNSLPLVEQVGLYDASELALTDETGSGDESALTLSEETRGGAFQPVTGTVHQRNERRRAQEED